MEGHELGERMRIHVDHTCNKQLLNVANGGDSTPLGVRVLAAARTDRRWAFAADVPRREQAKAQAVGAMLPGVPEQ